MFKSFLVPLFYKKAASYVRVLARGRSALMLAARKAAMTAKVRQVRVGSGWASPSVSATPIPPMVWPPRRATEIMPLALPVRLRGAVVSMDLLLGV